VQVLNKGKIASGTVDVSLSVDRAVLDTVTVSNLAAGETLEVGFTGPVCSRGVLAKVDPDNTIGETIEGDNTQEFRCP
jgi:subtilase family serine protease